MSTGSVGFNDALSMDVSAAVSVSGDVDEGPAEEFLTVDLQKGGPLAAGRSFGRWFREVSALTAIAQI